MHWHILWEVFKFYAHNGFHEMYFIIRIKYWKHIRHWWLFTVHGTGIKGQIFQKHFLTFSMGLKDRYWDLYLHGFTPLPVIAPIGITSINIKIIYDLRLQTVPLNCMIMLCNQNFQAHQKTKTLAFVYLKFHHERKDSLSQFIFSWKND